MLVASKVLLIIAGIFLVIDSILTFAGTPPFGSPLPHPLAFLILAVGIILFAFSSKAFKKG